MPTKTLLILTFCAAARAITVVTEDGLEHPDAHLHGFVLSGVFVRHEDSEGQHALIHRRLSFTRNAHLVDGHVPPGRRLTGVSPSIQSGEAAISALDASTTRTRAKVRALAMLNFVNAAYDNPDFYVKQENIAEAEMAREMFYGDTLNQSYTATRRLWDAANAEARQVASNLGGSLVGFDTPGPPIGRTQIGVVCLLFKRGVRPLRNLLPLTLSPRLRYRRIDRLPGVDVPSQVASGPSADTILVFRDTATEGDYINIEGWVTPAIVDGSAEFGMAQIMKKQWLAAGLEWTSKQETLASSSSIVQRLIVQVHRAPIATCARPGERRPALERKLFFSSA